MENPLHLFIFVLFLYMPSVFPQNKCLSDDYSCNSIIRKKEQKYSKAANDKSRNILTTIENALDHYLPCEQKDNCSCFTGVINDDLEPFRDGGISKVMFEMATGKGVKYQIIEGRLYRQKECNFPARCAGVEHYLLDIVDSMPNLEFIINVRDWPQVNYRWGHRLCPVFSFSKTEDYRDIMYPAWSFWEGGPAIKLYPTGLGKWHQHRKTLKAASEKWPWDTKNPQVFFRGSRTSNERDAVVLLSRSRPDIADAQYTKNQAWKSDADTLHMPPAAEVSLEDHCKFKYLFNYRGVAASFRFKHLFLCNSLVFHVGDEWQEFFYSSLKPWVHYVPVRPTATQDDLLELIEFFRNHDKLAAEIAQRGFNHIWDNLRIKDVKCYWNKLMNSYANLLNYTVEKDINLIEIKD